MTAKKKEKNVFKILFIISVIIVLFLVSTIYTQNQIIDERENDVKYYVNQIYNLNNKINGSLEMHNFLADWINRNHDENLELLSYDIPIHHVVMPKDMKYIDFKD